ncbi:biotin transporter BioY [Thermodesulfovibrionales bacterium]|nr:biotin transporter BioY [Thermodesulfovibrionales bacterium]
MVFSAMFAALTALGAFITIPIGPVPITLQPFFIHLGALLLGGYLGALSQFIYVLVGVMGLPVFSGGGSGIGHLLGPTGGYLIGFIVGGGYLTGRLAEMKKKPGFLWLSLSCAADRPDNRHILALFYLQVNCFEYRGIRPVVYVSQMFYFNHKFQVKS